MLLCVRNINIEHILRSFNFSQIRKIALIASIVNTLLAAHCVDKMFTDYKPNPRGRLSKEKIADIKQRIVGLMLSKVAGTTRNALRSKLYENQLTFES